MTLVPVRLLTLLGWLALVFVATQAGAQEICVGDCDGNGAVSIDELVIGVNIALAATCSSAAPTSTRTMTAVSRSTSCWAVC